MPIPIVGDNIRITGVMPEDPDPIEVGATGTVTGLQSHFGSTQIYVDWSNGRSLILLDTDPFEILPTTTGLADSGSGTEQ